MAAEKLSPRQKMIGMMYLVLTAMLALNVQREVLDAFVLINDGVESTNESAEIRNAVMLNEFKFAHDLDPQKTGPFFTAAQQIAEDAKKVTTQIDDLVSLVIEKTEGLTESESDTIRLRYVEKLDAMDEATYYMVGKNDQVEQGEARALRNSLQSYESAINTQLTALDLEPLEANFDFSSEVRDGEEMEWELKTFYDMPLAAVVTMLNKLKSDVLAAENEALSRLLANVDRNDFPVDTVLARVVPESRYVMQGQTYRSEIFLGAYSTTLSPEVIIQNGAGGELAVENGVALYEQATGQTGVYSYSGEVRMADKQGRVRSFPFKSEYIVTTPTAVVSPTAMNVLYVGVDNPIAISVPGIPDDQVRVSINGGNNLVKQSNGRYMAKMSVNSPASADVSVKAEIDGQLREMSKVTFRVKRLPAPKCRIGSIEGSGKMRASDLKIQNLICEYEKDFPLDLPRPRLVRYNMVIQTGNEVKERAGTTNRLTSDMQALLDRTPPGSKVYFEDIMVVGNDDREHKLPPLVVSIIR